MLPDPNNQPIRKSKGGEKPLEGPQDVVHQKGTPDGTSPFEASQGPVMPPSKALSGASFNTDREQSEPRSTTGPSQPERGGWSASGTVVDAVLVGGKSPAIWNGFGATAVCLGSTALGAACHALLTVWTFRNELRMAKRAGPVPTFDTISPGRGGLFGLVGDLARSPGVGLLGASAAYLVASAHAGIQGYVAEAGAFFAAVVGLGTYAALANRNYQGTRTDKALVERMARAAWNAIPERLQHFILNPGPWVAACNITLVLNRISISDFSDMPVMAGALIGGVAIASLGLMQATGRLVLGRSSEETRPTAFATYLNSAGNLLVAAASFASGQIGLGVANSSWCLSNLLFGKAITDQNKSHKLPSPIQ